MLHVLVVTVPTFIPLYVYIGAKAVVSSIRTPLIHSLTATDYQSERDQ